MTSILFKGWQILCHLFVEHIFYVPIWIVAWKKSMIIYKKVFAMNDLGISLDARLSPFFTWKKMSFWDKRKESLLSKTVSWITSYNSKVLHTFAWKTTTSPKQRSLGTVSNNQNGNSRWPLPWRGVGSRGGLECHIPILKNDFFKKNHLESFPDC